MDLSIMTDSSWQRKYVYINIDREREHPVPENIEFNNRNLATAVGNRTHTLSISGLACK